MKTYIETDRQLHLLSQLIAKANRTYHSPAEDDSHTNIAFDALGKRLHGRWLQAKDQKLLFTLNLDKQAFEVINEHHKNQALFHWADASLSDVEQQLVAHLPALGLDPKGFAEKLHFEIPDYDFASAPLPAIKPADLKDWMHYRELANEACCELLNHAQMMGETRIWPHHFDTGIFAPMTEAIGVGFGMAMADEAIDVPYYYMSGYLTDGSTISYQNLPMNDRWEWKTEGTLKGAFLRLTELEGKPASEQQSLLRQFMLAAFHWFIQQR